MPLRVMVSVATVVLPPDWCTDSRFQPPIITMSDGRLGLLVAVNPDSEQWEDA